MSAPAIASIVFLCVFGGALLGIGLRHILPEHHLNDASKDVVRLGMGLVATMAALVLGLLIASAKTSYDAQNNELDQISADFILLDGTLARYGPEARTIRDQLRGTIEFALERIWAPGAPEATAAGAFEPTAARGFLYHRILDLEPQTDRQRMLQSQALQIGLELGQARWLLVTQLTGSSISMPFLAVLVFWLFALFASFGLFAPSNATVFAVVLVGTLSVSGAIFLILELAQPFEGILQLSSAPLRGALAHLAQ
ncbi:hypothetical protein QFZ27_001688 [Inquilinus ginsengisoli]|uniref:bestrophin-like domain n=1 Tax=Inquilinus ginsengisoli TaxID=363840 RepID=UPI003D249CF1